MSTAAVRPVDRGLEHVEYEWGLFIANVEEAGDRVPEALYGEVERALAGVEQWIMGTGPISAKASESVARADADPRGAEARARQKGAQGGQV